VLPVPFTPFPNDGSICLRAILSRAAHKIGESTSPATKTDLPSRVKRRRIVHNESTTPPFHVASVLPGVFASGREPLENNGNV
jgi:hypothetical protein